MSVKCVQAASAIPPAISTNAAIPTMTATAVAAKETMSLSPLPPSQSTQQSQSMIPQSPQQTSQQMLSQSAQLLSHPMLSQSQLSLSNSAEESSQSQQSMQPTLSQTAQEPSLPVLPQSTQQQLQPALTQSQQSAVSQSVYPNPEPILSQSQQSPQPTLTQSILPQQPTQLQQPRLPLETWRSMLPNQSTQSVDANRTNQVRTNILDNAVSKSNANKVVLTRNDITGGGDADILVSIDGGANDKNSGGHSRNAVNNFGGGGVILNRRMEERSLRPPDGGWGWAVVAAAFFINMASDGISFSFGLLYIEFLQYFGQSRSTTSWVGSLFMAVPMLTGPLASAMVDRFGCRAMTILGGIVSGVGFVVSAWAETIGQMYLTFGVLAGLGLGLCFITAVVSIAYWFERRRTLAMSLGAAGTGFGTFIYAPVTNYFISEFGWRGTVLLLAGTFFNLCVCGVVMRDPAWWVAEQARARQVVSEVPAAEVVPLRTRVVTPNPPSPVPTTHHSPPNAPLTDGNVATPLLQQRAKIPKSSGVSSIPVPIVPPPAVVLLRADSVPCFRRRLSLLGSPSSLSSLPTLPMPAMVVNGGSCRCPRGRGILSLLRAVVDFSLFLELHFFLMSVGTALLYMWFIVPYFYLADYLTTAGLYSQADASALLAVVGITNTIGMVVLGWVGDHPRVHATKTYALCLMVCGLSTAAMPPLLLRHWFLGVACATFGASFASTFSFTPTILAQLVPMERFTVAYGLNLLCQGVGTLLGPPLAGWLFDVTQTWDLSFYIAGLNICIAAGLTALIPYTKNRRLF